MLLEFKPVSIVSSNEFHGLVYSLFDLSGTSQCGIIASLLIVCNYGGRVLKLHLQSRRFRSISRIGRASIRISAVDPAVVPFYSGQRSHFLFMHVYVRAIIRRAPARSIADLAGRQGITLGRR